jgi:hypothetical protein
MLLTDAMASAPGIYVKKGRTGERSRYSPHDYSPSN